MKRLTVWSGFYLIIDIALLIVCLLHVPSILQRPRAPFDVVPEHDRIFIHKILKSEACPALRPGDEIEQWDGMPVTIPELLEYYAGFSSIGDKAEITYRRSNSVSSTLITLTPFYTKGNVVVYLIVGILTWCLAVYVLLKRPNELTASLLHWSMITMAVVVMVAWEGIAPNGLLPIYLSSVLFFVSYAGLASTFFFLTAMFPRPKPGSAVTKALFVYIPAIGLLVFLLFYHWRAIFLHSSQDFITFQVWFDIFHISLYAYIGGGLFNFVHSYVTSASREDRKKLKWILFGLCVGPTPFLLFTDLPILLGQPWFVPEEYTLAFLVVIAIAFAISFVKYHILDIEVVINRATVYAIVLGLLVAFYVGIVGVVTHFVGSYASESYALAAVLVGLLFEPARRRVQRFVDKRFFRVSYNFRETEHRFIEEIKHCLDLGQLAELLVTRTDELIPVERIGFFTLKQPGHRLYALAHKNFDLFEKHSIPFHAEKLKTRLELPVALAEKVEQGIPYEPADGNVFRRWGMVLVFPLLSENFEFLGFLVLGEKKSGGRFSSEDIDLLRTVTTQAGLAIERLTLQVKLVLEHAETQRLEELNRLKSDFVSYVSHELRTPLTSIKMFAELLGTRPRTLDKKSQDYVRTIEGEADRLDRMVTTILDSARIDQGGKEYSFTEVDLREITEKVLSTMKYQLNKQGFRVKFKPTKRHLPIYADADAVATAVINLISNSIKYSADKKYLSVSLTRQGTWSLCRVEDRGRGISPGALPHLFEKFYRDPAHSDRVQGVGLGLPLVKHVMDAHGGRVDVKSALGKGSVFCLWFPAKRTNHEPQKENPRRRRR